MPNIVINRLPIDVDDVEVAIFLSRNHLHYRKKPSWIAKDFSKKHIREKLDPWISSFIESELSEEEWVYYDFNKPVDQKYFTLKCNYNDLPKAQKKDFITFNLIQFFRQNGFIVEPYTIGNSFQVYEKLNKNYNGWECYREYDITVHVYYHTPTETLRSELTISIGSEDTWFGEATPSEISKEKYLKIVDKETGYLLSKGDGDTFDSNQIVKANFEVRKRIGINPKPVRVFYKKTFETLSKFKASLSEGLEGPLFIRSEYRTVHPADIQMVDFENNKMVFESGKEQISAVNGMREFGPYYIPEHVNDIKLLFIYPDSKAANTLYKYFRRGYGYFPGLTSYTGIPTEPAQERLEYQNNLKKNFDDFLKYELNKNTYKDYLAIIITPFFKETASNKESQVYYYIKQKLLEKNIASQFIGRHRIFSSNFKYHLPNIAIAMLAKCGGVPWKLKKKNFTQLTVGFNIERQGDYKYLGSAVYYDNEGLIKQVIGFKPSGHPESFIKSLKTSVQHYLQETDAEHRRLVIHYYKPVSGKELQKISKLIRNEFKINIPFAVVEINDSKTRSEICFDLDYKMLMPQSGTYVRTKPNEFLLFNNERYWNKPQKPIRNEEYPLKIRLYNYDQGGFTHHELISQVYEFSRLHWKGLKQKSNPVTTDYAKEVARFIANFEENRIPINEVSQKTVWFI